MNFIKKLIIAIVALSIVASLSLTLTGCPSKPLIEEVEETTSEITPTEEEEEEEEEEWDLVIFGDSTAWGFGKYYAAYIEEDLGIKVTVHNKTYPRQTAFGILKKLHDDEELRELVSGAEVVTFIGNPEGSRSETHSGDWECVEAKFYVINCSLETFEKYIADLETTIEEILSLQKYSPTIIRAMDYYNPIYSKYKEYGIYEECKQCWENLNKAIHQAAAAHNVPVAHVYDAFNGPNHD